MCKKSVAISVCEVAFFISFKINKMLINLLKKFFRGEKHPKMTLRKRETFKYIGFMQIASIEVRGAKLENQILSDEEKTDDQKIILLEENTENTKRLVLASQELTDLILDSDEVDEILENARVRKVKEGKEEIQRMLDAKQKHLDANEK